MKALIDADIVAYRCAATAENDGPEIACLRADVLMRQIIDTTKAKRYLAVLSGDNNFREFLYPEYKANRKGKPRPKYLQETKEFLIREWNAEISEGCEADDLLGSNQNLESIICSIDKDLLQVPGRHYNFVKNEFYEISEIEGWRNFYKQLILGDVSDNIPGYDGKARIKCPKFLLPAFQEIDRASRESEMFNTVLGMYEESNQGRDNLERNGQLLYIWRKENDKWIIPQLVECS